MSILSSRADTRDKNSGKNVLPENLKLTAKIHPLIAEWLAKPSRLFELTQALGSPLNLLFPELLAENVAAFHACLNAYKLRGRIYFAHKSNRSDSLARALSVLPASIDVSSLHELRHALGCGFAAARIQATGPKNREFLALSLMHGITISIDSLWELTEIISLRRQLSIDAETNILLRVCGFKSAHSQYRSKASRFGISLDQIESVFDLIEQAKGELRLLGFAFHLDTVSVPEKALAIENCLDLFEESFARGFEPTVLNIGGGFKVNYLENEDDWHNYTSALRQAVIGSREPITWQGNSFGLMADKGSLRGNFNTYSYYDALTGPRFLEEVLTHRFAHLGDAQAAALIRDNGIELWIEPGRALLDQTGITVARVNSLRRSSQGDTMVCLNMKRQDLCFLDQEIFVDPVVLNEDRLVLNEDRLALNEGRLALNEDRLVLNEDRLVLNEDRLVLNEDRQSEPGLSIPVYFAGNLCLETDLICRHQVFLPALPKPGDLVVFINTAGYFMDFSASQSIMQPPAQKVAIFKRNGQFTWSADEQYYPWLSQAEEKR